MDVITLLVLFGSTYFLISKAAEPTDTFYIKAGLTLMLAPFVFLLLGMLVEWLGGKGTVGFLFGAVAMSFVAFPVGLLLALMHVIARPSH